MLVVSFIRHGESLDNLRPVWAGHEDAELSELGVRQAKALGEAYASTHLDAIITSDLKRAHATAVALSDGQPGPKPTFKVDRDLREQCFGDGEGRAWLMRRIPDKSLDDHFRDGQYPILFNRDERFPNGESVNDVAVRAARAINVLVLEPHLARSVSEDIHVAVVSHGICISEMIPALLSRNDGGAPNKDYKGLLNTAWSRVTVQVKPGAEITDGVPLIVTVTDVNQHEHTANVVSRRLRIASHFLRAKKKRQKGIFEHDPKQRSIREFFGGGGAKEPVEHAMDEGTS